MGKPIKIIYAITCSIIYARKIQTRLCKQNNLKATTLNKEIESKMYSKNEAILDFKKKIQNDKKKKK